jgi:hypothetical protein
MRIVLGYSGRLCRTVEGVGGAHVLPLPRLYPLSVVDRLLGADYRHPAGKGRGAAAGLQHFARLLGKGGLHHI